MLNNVTTCRDNRMAKGGKQGRDDSIERLSIQPTLQKIFFHTCVMKAHKCKNPSVQWTHNSVSKLIL